MRYCGDLFKSLIDIFFIFFLHNSSRHAIAHNFLELLKIPEHAVFYHVVAFSRIKVEKEFRLNNPVKDRLS